MAALPLAGRQSIDADDLLLAHIGGMDVCARGLLAAAAMLEDGTLEGKIEDRYQGWSKELGTDILSGVHNLETLAQMVEDKQLEPEPKSGQQELYENIINRFV